ncbi:MAG: 16S rRNA (cytosine(1402)-N(4))-methyltransferase RsmH [Fretibacterium sp.]|nr:16S rRNA (cytosine(1402)-N(4))-methyltransferase RsmH [Fretibacterium sp.]
MSPEKVGHFPPESDFGHEPVLLKEVLAFLEEGLSGRNVPGGERKRPGIVDGTLGLGGYSEAMLRKFPQAEVIGIDRDAEALRRAKVRLEAFGPRFSAVHSNFGNLRSALTGEGPEGSGEPFDQATGSSGVERLRSDESVGCFGSECGDPLRLKKFDAFVFDLGVSNMQLSEGERGFSFQRDGPLDMRMDPGGDFPTAAEVLARTDVKELARIFWEYGEERHSRRIAARIEEYRRKGKSPRTTGELTALIRGCLPEPVQRKMGGHPARRVFQALRIYVNDELGELEAMLEQLPVLAAEGCLAVIVSYHSLEDRIVKHRFRGWEKEMGWGRILTKHPIVPGEEEMERNYKSRSAKLRAFRFN